MTVNRVTRIFYAVADRRASLIGFANELMAEHTIITDRLKPYGSEGNQANFPIYKWLCVLLRRSNVPFYFRRVFLHAQLIEARIKNG